METQTVTMESATTSGAQRVQERNAANDSRTVEKQPRYPPSHASCFPQHKSSPAHPRLQLASKTQSPEVIVIYDSDEGPNDVIAGYSEIGTKVISSHHKSKRSEKQEIIVIDSTDEESTITIRRKYSRKKADPIIIEDSDEELYTIASKRFRRLHRSVLPRNHDLFRTSGPNTSVRKVSLARLPHSLVKFTNIITLQQRSDKRSNRYSTSNVQR